MAATVNRNAVSIFMQVFRLFHKNSDNLMKYVCYCNLHCTSTFEQDGQKGMKGRKLSSQLWLKRHMDDPYVKRARLKNYRCRSAFKLIEIDDRYRILRPGGYVIDCGAAPGSWMQVAVERTRDVSTGGPQPTHSIARVIGVDIIGFPPVDEAKAFANSDFTLPETQKTILQYLQGRKVDAVLSDMAPNATGHKAMDHENIIDLCKSALRFSRAVLRPDGTFLCKIWKGGLEKDFMQEIQQFFKSVKFVKPLASRMDSAEGYLLSRGYKGLPDKT
ncbi:rRNA methyltransferase 2, mitochondrial-like [Lineus longissimus]|uniref:rRNA methyltransferase 2, mitochondrial-like n=1 Tax=Lineus longissimus TaxID=88925 RepID=UPI002B4F7405